MTIQAHTSEDTQERGKQYWIDQYEQLGCIDLPEQEKQLHSAQEWREMVRDLREAHRDAIAEAQAS